MEDQQEEQLCKLGDEAEVLLKTPAFDATINQLVDTSFQAFVNSKPEDTQGRERSYSHYRALVDIVSTLQQLLLLSLSLPLTSF
tara:strand:+ start:869 stop:1120 length:252 start_codon:yes stop_codon:yes gene_type:complete